MAGHLRLEDGHPMRRCVALIRRNDAMMPSGIRAKSATQRKLRNDSVPALLVSFAAQGELEMSKYQGFGATAESSTFAPRFATNPSRNRGGLAERSNDLAIPQFVQHSLRGRLG